jgi:hypothetical protein
VFGKEGKYRLKQLPSVHGGAFHAEMPPRPGRRSSRRAACVGPELSETLAHLIVGDASAKTQSVDEAISKQGH